MSIIEQSTLYLLNIEQIDNEHRQFVDLINQLYEANNEQFGKLFEQLLIHTEQHFQHENQLMDQYRFPATGEHKGEHLRVLGEFKQFKKRVDKGLIAFGRAYIKDSLPSWFDLHIKTMDSALAAHVNKQHSK